jgi:hypothetical protein
MVSMLGFFDVELTFLKLSILRVAVAPAPTLMQAQKQPGIWTRYRHARAPRCTADGCFDTAIASFDPGGPDISGPPGI